MTATLFRLKWTRIQVFHDNNRDFKSGTLVVGGERCPGALFESCGTKTSIKNPFHGLFFFFYLSSKQNRKFKHLVQTKPMGENTITHIIKVFVAGTQWYIMKVSVAGTSLKESEKKVYESLCKKNNSQEADESKDCKFRTYCPCHRPQKYKFHSQLQWSQQIRATMTLAVSQMK